MEKLLIAALSIFSVLTCIYVLLQPKFDTEKRVSVRHQKIVQDMRKKNNSRNPFSQSETIEEKLREIDERRTNPKSYRSSLRQLLLQSGTGWSIAQFYWISFGALLLSSR